MDDFLPPDYEPPKASGRYTKLEDGKTTRVRALSSPIIGWVFWDKVGDNKPVRLEYTEENLAAARAQASKNPKADDKKVNHFWIMPVWNYDTKQVEVFEITQKTIQASVRNLIADEEYGSPLKYDLKITKEKNGDRTNYEVSPGVPKDTIEEALDAYKASPINLRALYYGADPFDTMWSEEAEIAKREFE